MEELSNSTESVVDSRMAEIGKIFGWQDYAFSWLKAPFGRYLEYGCGPGSMLKLVAAQCDECWGVDVDIERAASERLASVHLKEISPEGTLPFEDNYFDTVSIQEVIEHVADEKKVLSELTRVLKPGGQLILTTPHRGLLTWMDPANVKFVAPRIHRLVHRLMGNKEYYERSFGKARREEKGMISDFTLDQSPWHRHYTFEQIRELSPPELVTTKWAVYFPAMRAFWCLGILLRFLTRNRHDGTLPEFVRNLQSRFSRSETLLGDQLVVLFKKKASQTDDRQNLGLKPA